MSEIARQLEIITEQYYNEIYKYCRRRVRTDDIAYDITQNVFLALSEGYLAIDHQKIHQWLYKTSKNKIADYYRELIKIKDNITDVPLSDIKEESNDLTYDPFHEADDEEINKLVKMIIDKLEPVEKELYIERYVNKAGYDLLSKKHAISEQGMRKRVSRLHNKIKQIMFEILNMIVMLII